MGSYHFGPVILKLINTENQKRSILTVVAYISIHIEFKYKPIQYRYQGPTLSIAVVVGFLAGFG